MIKKRDMMIAALTLTLISFLILLVAALKNSAAPEITANDDGSSVAENVSDGISPQLEQDAADAVTGNIFSATRGAVQETVEPTPPSEPEKKEEPVSAKTEEEVTLNMLGSYPNDWPRFKLTGVSCVRGRYTAIIRGGPEHKVTSGEVFARNYTIGDDLSGGVTLYKVKIDEREALLRRGNDVLSIKLGVEPPEVKK